MIKLIGSRQFDARNICNAIWKFIGVSPRVTDVSDYSFYDVCSGTGSVSIEMNFRGLKNIFLNDSCYYCYIESSSKFEMGAENGLQKLYNYIMNRPDDYKCDAIERESTIRSCLNNLPPKKGFITEHYTELWTPKTCFYSVENAMMIDAARIEIEFWDKLGLLTKYEKNYLLARLVESATDYANVKFRYDCAVKCNKRFNERMRINLYGFARLPLQDRPCVTQLDIENTVIKGDDKSIAFFDPPFQRHDYTYQYGLPITIEKYDNPSVRGTYNLRQMEPASNFCRRARYMTAFINSIKNLQTRYIFCTVPVYDNKATFDNQQIDAVLQKMNFKRYERKKIYSFKGGDNDLKCPWRKFFDKARALYIYCIER